LNAAGTTVAVAAALFGPGQAEVFAQDFQQTLARFAEKGFLFTIDRGLDNDFLWHRFTPPL
jgi:hypothetical protein